MKKYKKYCSFRFAIKMPPEIQFNKAKIMELMSIGTLNQSKLQAITFL
ncbi:MAG: hypothetical protein WCX31_00970 [Salinivirgaceae bacterium]